MRKEKAFRNAMIAPPLGGLYGAASVAELEGKTEITINVSLRRRVAAIKADHFVKPTAEFRLEAHEACPMPYKGEMGSSTCSPQQFWRHMEVGSSKGVQNTV